jgi:hypothetical protein
LQQPDAVDHARRTRNSDDQTANRRQRKIHGTPRPVQSLTVYVRLAITTNNWFLFSSSSKIMASR